MPPQPQRFADFDPIRKDLFHRLHWPVFGPYSAISVFTSSACNPDEPGALTPFQNNCIDSEIIGDPPCSMMQVNIDELVLKQCFDYSDPDDQYQPPGPVCIVSREGEVGAITLGRFVEEVHDYLNTHRDEIISVMGETYTTPVPDSDSDSGMMVISVGPDTSTSPRGNNIPQGMEFFADEISAVECGDEGPSVQISIFASGNMGETMAEFWARKAWNLKCWRERITLEEFEEYEQRCRRQARPYTAHKEDGYGEDYADDMRRLFSLP